MKEGVCGPQEIVMAARGKEEGVVVRADEEDRSGGELQAGAEAS